MKFFNSFFLFIYLFIVSPINLFSQTADTPQQEVTTIYYYDFSGELSSSIIAQIETEVNKLTHVTETKIKYKEEKRLGQLIVIVKEKPRKSEGDKLFQPTDLKKIISQHGLLPKEIYLETRKP